MKNHIQQALGQEAPEKMIQLWQIYLVYLAFAITAKLSPYLIYAASGYYYPYDLLVLPATMPLPSIKASLLGTIPDIIITLTCAWLVYRRINWARILTCFLLFTEVCESIAKYLLPADISYLNIHSAPLIWHISAAIGIGLRIILLCYLTSTIAHQWFKPQQQQKANL